MLIFYVILAMKFRISAAKKHLTVFKINGSDNCFQIKFQILLFISQFLKGLLVLIFMILNDKYSVYMFNKWVILPCCFTSSQYSRTVQRLKIKALKYFWKISEKYLQFFFTSIAWLKNSITFAASKNDMVRSSRG